MSNFMAGWARLKQDDSEKLFDITKLKTAGLDDLPAEMQSGEAKDTEAFKFTTECPPDEVPTLLHY